LSTDGINFKTDPREPLFEDYTNHDIYHLDADFQEHMHVVNTVDDASTGYGGRILPQSHSTGYPYEDTALSLYAAPTPHVLPPQVSSAANESMSTEPVKDIQDGQVDDSMRSANQLNSGIVCGSISAPLVQLNDLMMSNRCGNNGSPPWLNQSASQPNLNIPSFPFGPVNPIQQRTPCPWIGCSESFVRSTDVQRHWDSVHLGIKHHCDWPGCPNNGGKGYCRLEKLRTHQRQKHGFSWA
jgi:hypothetical protein